MAVHAAHMPRQKAAPKTRTAAAHVSWWPTQKWWAATIIATGGFLTTLATQGWHWTPEFAGAVITIATSRLVAYVVKNDATPGGVPGTPKP
jgi:hypothetical protein